MKRITKLALAASAVVAGLALSPALRAQDASGAQQSGMMQHGGMTNMMGRMNQMMDQCSRMMQITNDRPAPKSPDQQTPPASPDGKG